MARIVTYGALAAFIAVAVLGVSATYAISEWRPVASGLQPTLIFDSREEFFPTTINFDDDWIARNNPDHYDMAEVRPPIVARTHEVKYDNFSVVQFWYYYTRNEGATINYHPHDEEHANVYVRDGDPFLLVLYAHGSPTIHRVVDQLDLWAYIGWGSHGMTKSRTDPLVLNDALGRRVFDYDIQSIEPELEHEATTIDALGYYVTDEPGDLIPPPWSSLRENDQYWNPALEIVGTDFEEDLKTPSSVPLTAADALPSARNFAIIGVPIALVAAVLGFVGGPNIWKGTAILGMLFVLGVVGISFMTYSADLMPLSMWVSVFRTVPYVLLAASIAFVSFVVRLGLTQPKELAAHLPKLKGFGIVFVGISFGMWQTQVVSWAWPVGVAASVAGLWLMGRLM